MKKNNPLLALRACRKCGAVDRNSRYDCMACARARALAFKLKNPEAVKARYARSKPSNPDANKIKCAAWAKANPDLIRIHWKNNRAKRYAAQGKLSAGLSSKLFAQQKGKCPCCKQPLGNDFHMDHMMPLSLGGSNTDDNMQLLRKKCNLEKHAKHPVDFMQSRGFLL